MKQGRFIHKLALASGILLATASQQASAISINLDFLGGLSTSQQTIFTQAEQFWESVLIGYKPGIDPSIETTGISISAEGTPIDGVGGILGSAGPLTGWNSGGYILTATGAMTFDSADLANLENNGSLGDVILHEMAHVLGLGTLWELNGLYTQNSGEYTGAFGLAAYQDEFNQPGATFIPVELGGGPGTANGHWDEVDGGAGLTGITDSNGNDMRNELMTGWLNAPAFVSNTTKMSFQDLGYEVAAVPVPAAAWLFISGLGLLFGFSARKKTTH